ncbi:hypothetical protein FHX74_003198 [Friedmanniella endophytica]|uniref:Uncharacterized protein n=1 Tax=Microlunatus kandeliicorticis TaxID=1759536 RepID=A0A7W3IUP1_9ACTN|nr:hypothetical protein [Microlunatus kandeliicorticis]MBA8795562.1 hypothetical protein [Microlunatus kandeliicorticis]
MTTSPALEVSHCPRWCTSHSVLTGDPGEDSIVIHTTLLEHGGAEFILSRELTPSGDPTGAPDQLIPRCIPAEMTRAAVVELLAMLEDAARRMDEHLLTADQPLPEPRSREERLGRAMMRAGQTTRGHRRAAVR